MGSTEVFCLLLIENKISVFIIQEGFIGASKAEKVYVEQTWPESNRIINKCNSLRKYLVK